MQCWGAIRSVRTRVVEGNAHMEIWRMSAANIAALEAVRSALDRAAEVNPRVNALVEIREEEALEAAQQADDRLGRGDDVGPLHGVPITTKVNTGVAGLPTTDGVGAYAENIASETDPQLTALLDAGAILVGRTNCPPFAMRWTTESDFYAAEISASFLPRRDAGREAATPHRRVDVGGHGARLTEQQITWHDDATEAHGVHGGSACPSTAGSPQTCRSTRP
jgi:hypothetical protein